MDPNFNLKGLVLLASLLVLSVVSASLAGYVFWDPLNTRKLLTTTNWVIAFVFDLPPIVCFVLLSWAFFTLERCKANEQQVSRIQIIQ
jgi:hypothetical protein